MNKVFVVNKGGHSYDKAARFGKVIFLSEGMISPFSTSKMYRIIIEGMKDSRPTDKILVTGLTVMNCIACSIFAYMHGRINLLLYKDKDYIERTVDISSINNGGD